MYIKYWLSSKAYTEFLRSREAEPKISKEIQEIMGKFPVSMAGWESRKKTKASFYEKLYCRGERRNAQEICDLIRYTVIVPEEEYTNLVRQIIACLLQAGFRCIKCKNLWTGENFSYHAIHFSFEFNGTRGEIQFHTKSSFKAREESHKLYEQARILPKQDPRRKCLEEKASCYYEGIPIPKGVDTIPEYYSELIPA